MKLNLKIIPILCLLGIFASCEKEVHFNLPRDITEKLVVEGTIENGAPPFVLLTNSLGFFSKIDLSNLENAFVSGAIVKVSDGSNEITLREYIIDTVGNKFMFYTVDSSRPQDFGFLGQVGKTYHLSILSKGKTYEATTTIPQPVEMDSMWSESYDLTDTEHPEYKKAIVRYTDPPAKGNKYRYYVKQNDKGYLAPRFSTFNDDVINGTVQDFDVFNVTNSMDTTTDISANFFKPGDKVTVKLSAIDSKTFDFWQTLDFSLGTTGNPFSTPIKVPTNISGGALGIWAGYAPTYKTIVIQP